jgi:hydrogenase nickel incorporation protein HypA/HybF
MHEVSICESILDILKETAAKEGAKKVTSVRLRVGEMAGVLEDSLRFAFEVVTKDTLAEGARLDIENVPLAARCRSCGREFRIVGYAFSCKHCDSPEIEVVSGRELLIEDIDLEA